MNLWVRNKNMLNRVLDKMYSKWPILLYDILAIPCAWFLAYWFRFNLDLMPHEVLAHTLAPLIILSITQITVYYRVKAYRGVWRYSSLDDLTRIIKSVILATLIAIPILFFTSTLKGVPRSVLPMYAGLLITLMTGGRLVIRMMKEKSLRQQWVDGSKRVLIIGAGSAGEGLVRDISRLPEGQFELVGFLDDKKSKLGLEIHGVKVLGSIFQIETISKQKGVELIFITIPSASSSQMRRIVSFCNTLNLPFRTLPSIGDIVDGRVTMNALRDVKLEDLLGRDLVELEWLRISSEIKGKTILITGGGGSIGAELCRQVAKLKPNQLIVIDNSEFNLYAIEHELQRTYPNLNLSIHLLSILDEDALDAVFSRFKPQLVFHAAAYKHVPMLESQARVAVRNNVIGTKVVAQTCVKNHCEKFVLISTDKAVNPMNVMGVTKSVAEIYCQNLNSQVATEFITVRFGNVLGSAGSVVPLFKKQLKQGGPLTVTHPDITRYFMTIPEACQLILQAMANGAGGEIFVLDMGEPIKISYLAEQMIKLSGKEPYDDIDITFTGLRPGEKLYEELFHEKEQLDTTGHEKILKAKHRVYSWEYLETCFEQFEYHCQRSDEIKLKRLLIELVPEYGANVQQHTSNISAEPNTMAYL
jgi:FlaA1/EpsC-like NDP-sugar epimerase